MSSQTTNRSTKSQKAGLIFPVARVKSMLKAQEFGQRVSDLAAVYLAAVLQFITTEVLQLALTTARKEKMKRIMPDHVSVAVKKDQEYIKHFKFAIIPYSRFIPCDERERLSGQTDPERRSAGNNSRPSAGSNSRAPAGKSSRTSAGSARGTTASTSNSRRGSTVSASNSSRASGASTSNSRRTSAVSASNSRRTSSASASKSGKKVSKESKKKPKATSSRSKR